MVRFPKEVLHILEYEDASTQKLLDENNNTIGYDLNVVFNPIFPRQHRLIGVRRIVWTFDLNNKIHKKRVFIRDERDINPVDVARGVLDGHSIYWYQRDLSLSVVEREASLGSVILCTEFHWNVETSLQSTLQEELDIRQTQVLPVPTVDQLDLDDIPWESMPSPCNKLIDSVLHKVEKVLHNNNLLQYSSILDIPNTNRTDRRDGSVGVCACDLCGCCPCVWDYNKNAVKADNSRLLSSRPLNKQRRELAYKQFKFALSVSGPKLPKCVVEKISSEWPTTDDESDSCSFLPSSQSSPSSLSSSSPSSSSSTTTTTAITSTSSLSSS